jgi:endonuclease/exonuclease/phosphatase family metal-dependent hydrolase
MAIKLVTLNIEGHHHLERFLPFLRSESPDVVCLQEVFASDLDRIKDVLQMDAMFAPMMRIETENKYRISPLGEWGVAFLTRLSHSEPEVAYYRQEGERLPVFAENPNDPWRVVVSATVEKAGEQVVIATTHFTWSPEGKTTDEQRRDFVALQQQTTQFERLVLCGDFNAPRGGELRLLFRQDFVDTIPDEVRTTLDPLLHYAGPLYFVVDGIFARGYSVADVRVVPGVSDHMAVVGEIGGQLVSY